VDRAFNVKELVERLNRGEFDGRLHDQLRELSLEQLEEVALLVAARPKAGAAGKTDGAIGRWPDVSSRRDESVE
jgi:hypothetical protein